MSTLAIMKARIADELGQRTDLDSQIALAITDAIAAYQNERFHFTERRTITFPTVAGQEFYDDSDEAALGLIWSIRYVMLLDGDNYIPLQHMDAADMEALSVNATNTGQPSSYTWYGDQIRLYPAPDQVWTVRVGAAASVAAPATDGEADNPWMTHAERLIRSRAKLELSIHVTHEQDTALAMGEAVKEAWRQLKDKSWKRMAAPNGRVKAMDF